MFSSTTHQARSLVRRPILRALTSLILLAVVLPLTGCASFFSLSPHNDLVEAPAAWEVRASEQTSRLNQVDLATADGQGRLMVAEYELERRVDDSSQLLDDLHFAMLDRVRTRSRVVPFSDHMIFWSNGFVGRRTKLRGRLKNLPVTLVASTVTNGSYVYFNYGLFFQDTYLDLQMDHQAVLETIRPFRGATILHEERLETADDPRMARLERGSELSRIADEVLTTRRSR